MALLFVLTQQKRNQSIVHCLIRYKYTTIYDQSAGTLVKISDYISDILHYIKHKNIPGIAIFNML